MPLYDSGDADGSLYFVMPYEEGRSLRPLRDGPLPVAECVSVLRDVARALAYAHEQGVVHRDVKPDNVMLSGGAAVVTDFGIAKAIAAAALAVLPRATARDLPATRDHPAWRRAGNAGVHGARAGARRPGHESSRGHLLVRLPRLRAVRGEAPFHDLPTHQIIAAHVGTVPVPLSEVSAAVPGSVTRLVARCLEKNPAARPQSAQELLAALESSSTGPNELVRHRRPLSRAALAASAIAAVVLVAAAGYVVSRVRAPSAAPVPHDVTVAVLPLVSTGDSVQRDLAYGLSDEIATALVKVSGVRVMSRRSVANSRDQRTVDTEKTGRELGAQFLVMGSLKEVNGRLTVLASLVQARDGAMVWADQFDRGPDEWPSCGTRSRKRLGTRCG